VRVVLLSRGKNTKFPMEGFGVYSINLYKGLLEKGIEVKLIPQEISVNVPLYGFFPSLLLYDILLPIKDFLRKVEADIFHALFESKGIFFPMLGGRKVITIHHIINRKEFPPRSIKEYIFSFYWDKSRDISIRSADHIIAVSEQTKTEILNYYNIPEETITVINHGISDIFRPLNVRKEPLRIGYIGALNRRKNIDFLIRAFYIFYKRYDVQNCRLVICGRGPEREKLIKLTEKLGIRSKVKFTGYVPSRDLVKVFNSFSVFVYPSLHEGFGFPILEAQKCGVPVIILKSAKIPQETGRCAVKAEDESDMAHKIYELLTDKKFSKRVIENGLNYARTFTWEKCIVETIKVYNKLLE